MPIKPRTIPGISRGDPIRASWLNKLVDASNGNITATPPITITQQAGNYNIAMNPPAKDWFIGKVTSDAASTFSDARYYVRRERIKCSASDTVGFSRNDVSDVSIPSDLNVVAVNLPELRSIYSDTTHLLPLNMPVAVFRTQDDSHPWNKKYFMWEHPRPCVHPMFVSYSDLSDLSASIADATIDIANTSDVKHYASDVSAIIVRGHMYKDKPSSDLNPWMVFKLPLCVDSDYSTWSDLAGLPASIRDTTLAISDIAASDTSSIYVTGHMYKDKASDLNPWMIFKQTGLFPVKAEKSDGVAGNSDNNCTFDYKVSTLDDKVIGHKLTPFWPRFTKTTYTAPSGTYYGLAFYDAGVLKLWQTMEKPAQSDCP